ncbi:hypothetical protein SAMN04487934_101641 [Eubacterium ruminantium]|nr:hypothetical protein SAMN04487934_101641 [Eubacterium ruminantium]
MKNFKKLAVVTLMLVAMVFTLCSCGSSNADGTYVIESMGDTNIADLLKTYKDMGLGDMTAEKLSKIVISGDDITISADGEKDQKGTVKVDGTTIKITIDGETVEGTLKDGKLTMSEGGMTMTYKKK